MRRGAKALWALLGLLFALTAAYWRLKSPEPLRRGAPDQVAPSGLANAPRLCVRVIDGDTIELEGGEHVRLIGINTPESVDPRRPVEHFGREAAAFTRRTVEGQRVRLEYDEETRDAYGRTLAYVYLADGTLLNAEIIRQGYGFAYTRFPYRRQAEFVSLEREAREEGRGLWAR